MKEKWQTEMRARVAQKRQAEMRAQANENAANETAVIIIERGRSYDGGFDYAQLASDEVDRDGLWLLGNQLQLVGCLQRLSGYEIVSERAIQALGERFTVADLNAFCAEMRRLIDEREARREANLVLCDCGHRVPRGQVMSASLGTSCPDCYDRMSDDCEW